MTPERFRQLCADALGYACRVREGKDNSTGEAALDAIKRAAEEAQAGPQFSETQARPQFSETTGEDRELDPAVVNVTVQSVTAGEVTWSLIKIEASVPVEALASLLS